MRGLGKVATCLVAVSEAIAADEGAKLREPAPRASLSDVPKESVPCGASLNLTYTLENPSSFPRTFVTWNTPLETTPRFGMAFDAFRFEPTGDWQYMGVKAKRFLNISQENTVTIEAHGHVSRTIDMSRYYQCASPAVSELWAAHPLLEVEDMRRLRPPVQLESNRVTLRTSARAATAAAWPSVELYNNAKGYLRDAEGGFRFYSSCNEFSGAQRLLEEGVGTAEEMLACTRESGYADPRNMFGGSKAPNRAQQSLSRAEARFNAGTFRVTCTSKAELADNTYAYVYPSDVTHTIHLEGAFWRAPPGNVLNSKVDTQAGTLIHEMMHFDDVGDADDIKYGFAILPPSQAIKNADTFEYYNEICLRSEQDNEEQTKTKKGCACQREWTLQGYDAQRCTDYCCNPDGDTADWCMVKDADCQGAGWGYCAAPPTPQPLCSNSCKYAHDGECDDGGPGAKYRDCELGTDCADCGERPASLELLAAPASFELLAKSAVKQALVQSAAGNQSSIALPWVLVIGAVASLAVIAASVSIAARRRVRMSNGPLLG